MNREKKKIMFFLPTLFHGGGERVISELSLNFPPYVETSIVLFEGKVSYPYKGKLIDLGVPLSANFVLRVYRHIPRFFRFRKVLAQEKPDFVITIGAPAALIALVCGAKVIMRVDTFVSQGKKGFFGFLYKTAARLFFPKAKWVVAVSHAAAEDLIQHFGIPKERVKVMYNPIDIPKIRQLAQERLDQHHEDLFQNPVVITMGRLSEEKQYEYLIDAFQAVKRVVPQAKLVILGEGELRGALEKKIVQDKLGGSIYLLGWQDNPYRFLIRAKLFVLSSAWEGFPMAMVEAMACGLPVVSFDCKSGPKEILGSGEYGVLVPEGDKHKLAQEITNMLSDEAKQREWSMKAKERARDFEVEKIIKEWSFL